jgi:hypothetical protein
MPKPKSVYRPVTSPPPLFKTLWFEGGEDDGVFEREIDVYQVDGAFYVFDGTRAVVDAKMQPKSHKTLTDAKKAARQYAAAQTADWYEGRLPAKALAARKTLESKYVKTRGSK